MIGIIDSGLGGICTWHYLHTRYPHTSFIVLADQKNAPYGSKTPADLLQIAIVNTEWFRQKGIREVVIACNTMCSVVYDKLERMFPDIRFYNIIDITARQIAQTDYHSVLIMATDLTIRFGRYEKQLRKLHPDRPVYTVACPKLVPIIEGDFDENALREALKEYLQPFDQKTDSVLLGCTHYPLASPYIKEILPVRQFDANEAISRLPIYQEDIVPENLIYTTGDPEVTAAQIEKLFGEVIEVRKADD